MTILFNKKYFELEELQEIISSSNDKVDACKKLGYIYTNGKIYNKLEQLCIDYVISIDHFDKSAKTKARRKYPVIKKNCSVCNKEFETRLGSPKEKITCSHKCSNVLFAASKHTPESNLKRSNSLIKFNRPKFYIKYKDLSKDNKIEKKCLFCSKIFFVLPSKNNRKYCSKQCSRINKSGSPETRLKLSVLVNARIANGTHKGWSSRSKIKPSYPEQYIIKLLEELNIKYVREFKVNKWFIDFADIDRKLSLEIDGKQHNLPERKASDESKDKYLIDNGWKVLRIKWRKIDKEFREFIIESIVEFFK